jgi:outer membrane protein
VIAQRAAQLGPAETVDRYRRAAATTPPAWRSGSIPAVMAAAFDVDVASTSIRVPPKQPDADHHAAGQPAAASDADLSLSTFGTDQASVTGQLTQPIYDGGTAASQTRQAKGSRSPKPAGTRPGPQPGPHRRDGAWVANEGAKVAVAASGSKRAPRPSRWPACRRRPRAASAPPSTS